MTLTVRLDPSLEDALDTYCTSHGVTKSYVVQESLATYLARPPQRARVLGAEEPSATYQAFERAGMVGQGQLGGGADKAAVRKRVTGR